MFSSLESLASAITNPNPSCNQKTSTIKTSPQIHTQSGDKQLKQGIMQLQNIPVTEKADQIAEKEKFFPMHSEHLP